MAKEKDVRTNAMRILDKAGIPYSVNTYECDEFVDALHVSDLLGQAYDNVLKTLVLVGKSGEHYVFVIPIAKELDMKKAARAVGEKSVQMLPTRLLQATTGYIRGGCTSIGMKKQFPTVLDASAMAFHEVIISGGRIGSQIVLSPTDLLAVTHGTSQDVLAI
ncbi:MAG: Cys-tRNA(Pro) deacylase [Clostridia bacterium]|nr:Cys-tRNA(Pro) deacylase [Clostridia bacterium]